MGYKFNPFTGNFDATDSPNGEFESLDVSGDINLDDGGTYETTVQVVTPTANRTISFPDATGTVALVAGSTGQLTYNNAGAQAGLTSASIGSTGQINISLAGAASTPPVSFTGSWFTGGTATTTKPQLLIEPTGTTSTAWSTGGTGLGVNAASGFSGRLLDLQTNGTSRMVVQGDGKLGLGTSIPTQALTIADTTAAQIHLHSVAPAIRLSSDTGGGDTANRAFFGLSTSANGFINGSALNDLCISGTSGGKVLFGQGNTAAMVITSAGNLGINSLAPGDKLEIGGAGAGIILASPDGTRYRLTVANGGTLSIAAV